MNLTKLRVVVAACVAVVLSLSACAAPITVAAAPETKPEASVAPISPEALDEWVYWTASPKSEMPAEYDESIRVLSEELGMGVVFEQPADSYAEMGWGGVAQYGSLCIIALGLDVQSTVDGSVMVGILSRYDIQVTVGSSWSADYAAIRAELTPYTQWCEEGGEAPEQLDGTELIPPQQATGA